MEGEATNALVTTIQPFVTALTSAVPVSTIVAILACAVGAGATLYMARFGINAVLRSVKKGLRGKFGI